MFKNNISKTMNYSGLCIFLFDFFKKTMLKYLFLRFPEFDTNAIKTNSKKRGGYLMKKNLFLALTLLVSVLLVACSNGNEDSTAVNDWEPTQYDTVNNFDGVSMNIKEGSVYPTGLTVIFENNSDKQCVYSDDFLIEKKIKGSWYQVPIIIDEYGFNGIGYELAPSANEEFTIDWNWLYGDLDTGEYRIVKKILDFRDTGDFDEYNLAAEFTID